MLRFNRIVGKKSVSLMRKVQASIKDGTKLFSDDERPRSDSGEELVVTQGDVKVSDQADDHLEALMARVTAKRGDIGCYLIFHCIEDIDQKAQDLLHKMPRFAVRKAIEKDESFTNPNAESA